MLYQEVKIKTGDTLSQLSVDYGYRSYDFLKIWNDYKNSSLRLTRKSPEKMLAGDSVFIPLPWKITSKTLTDSVGGWYTMEAKRNGGKGKYLRWVQTVFQDNQPIGSTDTFCVDACPPDDDEPFYYTRAELLSNSNYRTHFLDTPKRPSPYDRSTAWRAVLSLCSVFEKKVSILDSVVWGVDFNLNGTNSKQGPRKASDYEVNGHINLLKKGMGLTQSFKQGGWTFMKALEF